MFCPDAILIAEQDNKIVGSISLRIHNFEVKDKVFKVGVLEDAMTHPRFARRGICSNLTSLAIDVARSLEVDLIEAFPQYHNPTYRIFKYKFGFQEAAEINILLKPLRYFNTISNIPKLMTSQYLHGFFKLLTNPKALTQLKNLFSFSYKEHYAMNTSICNYGKGDESQIIEMMNRFYSRKAGYSQRTLEYWRWRYSLRPGFKPEHIFMTKLENKITGHVAISFQDYVLSREETSIRATFLYDLCSRNDRSNQKRQIESSLLTRACSYAGSNYGLFAITFTSARDSQTANLLRQVGFCVTGTFPALIKSVSEDFSVDTLQSEQLYVPVESIIK